MSIKAINEGFKSRFIGILNESIEPSQVDELRAALEDAAFELSRRQIMNWKAYEIAFQDAITKLYPDNDWWEITNCNIAEDLLAYFDIDHTINEIINQLKIDTSVDEAMMMPSGSDKEVKIATNDKGDYLVYKKGLGYSAFNKNEVSLGGFDEIKDDTGKVDHEAAKKKFLSGNFNESKSISEASKWVQVDKTSNDDYRYCGNGGRSWVRRDSEHIDTWDSREAAIEDGKKNYKRSFKFGTHWDVEELSDPLIEALHECLNRLNEATISDEDQRDSDIIRGIIAKLQKRSNARLTPEEQAIMQKYGIARDNDFRQLRVANRPLNPDYDGQVSKSYSPGQPWVPIYHRNGDTTKINYADRARKLPQRIDGQVSGRGTSNGQINSHTRSVHGQTLQDVERAAQEDRDTAPVRSMQHELDQRNYYTRQINNAQSVYDRAVTKARKAYDDEVRWATDGYRRNTVDASRYRDMAQARIAAMLGKGKKDNT